MNIKVENKSVVYVALGMPYYVMAMNSIRSLKRHNPSLPVVVVTDYSSETPPFDFWGSEDSLVFVPEGTDARTIKTSILDYVSTARNVFIDCDTEILGSLDSGFFLLNYFDVAMRPHSAPLKTSKGQFAVLGGSYKAVDMPHWNSGVIFFNRNERVTSFFAIWRDSYTSGVSSFDQVSLVDAVFKSDVKVCPLDLRWNGSTAHIHGDRKYSVILHYTSDVDKDVTSRLLSIARALDHVFSLSVVSELSEFLDKRKAARLSRGKSLTDMGLLRKSFYFMKRRIGGSGA